jgi:Domain of unknown function (DUF1707)
MTTLDELRTSIRQHAEGAGSSVVGIGPGMDDSIRVSDADRDRVTGQLRDHFAAGRITPGELDERLSAALTAKTFGDLRRIMADLPGPVPAPLGAAPPPLRATSARAIRRRHQPFPPLILLVLLAALLIPGTGWLLAAFLNVILLFWLMTFVAGAVALGRSQRRWHHHGGRQRPRYPSARHCTWL